MAKSLSVKIPTQLLIEEIEKNIAQIEKDIETYDERVAQYEKDTKAFEENLIKYGVNAVVANPNSVQYGEYRTLSSSSKITASIDYRGNVAIYVELDKDLVPNKPEKPENPNDKSYYGREYVTKLDLLKRNLKVLKMTNQDTVSASTYNSVMELL